MTSSNGQPPTSANSVRGLVSEKSSNERQLQSSNSTTAAFLGGKRKHWMNEGEGQTGSKLPSITVSSASRRPSHDSKLPSELSPIVDQYLPTQTTDFSKTPFPADFDRGRFPSQRRRRGGTKKHPGRSVASVASGLTSPVSSTVRNEAHASTNVQENGSHNANEILSSVSTNVTNCPQRTNIVDLEDERIGFQDPENPLNLALEDSVTGKSGEKAGRSYGDANMTRMFPQHVETQILNSTHPSDHSALHKTPSSTEDEARSVVPCQDPAKPAPSKRLSVDMSESRKRIQNPPEIPSNLVRPPMKENVDQGPLHTPLSVSFPPAEMRSFHDRVAQRLWSLNVANGPSVGPERPRLLLLRDACHRSDHFYLHLHQIYCMDHLMIARGLPKLSLTEQHRNGFVMLADVLVSNQKLSAEALDWFSNFPLPYNLLQSRPAFKMTHDQVRKCLTKLADSWKFMLTQSTRRGHPPLVEELRVVFGVESFTLQQVIFRAILRAVWCDPQDQCFQRAEELFPKSYERTMRRGLDPPAGTSEQDAKSFIKEYQQISFYHQQHMQNGSNQGGLYLQQRRASQLPRTISSSHNQSQLRHRQDNMRESSLNTGPQTTEQIAQHRNLTSTLIQPTITYNATPVPRLSQTVPANQIISTDGVFSPQRPAFDHSATSSEHPHNHRTPQRRVNSSAGSISSETRGYQGQTTMQGSPLNHIPPQQVSNQGSSNPQPGHGIQPPQAMGAQIPGSGFDTHAREPSGHSLDAYRRQSQSQRQSHRLPPSSTPIIRENPNITQAQTNPALNALHQAHVRSPICLVPERQGIKSSARDLFRCIEYMIMPPGVLSGTKRHISWDFNISSEIANSLVEDKRGECGSPPTRVLLPGSRLCRVRCIKVHRSEGLPTQNEWAVADNFWPSNTAIVLNDEALEIRKKSHHGKDLPVDATTYIKEGTNKTSASIIGFLEGSTARYAIGVEIIELLREDSIKERITSLPLHEARKRIMDRFIPLDPDILIFDSQINLNITDPFTSQLFTTPIRGVHCLHDQCFDRDVFIHTRHSKNTLEQPSSPDEFRCPICGQDARPQSLIVDGFFVQVREELEKRGRLDAKAIIMYPSGEWDVKEEEEVLGEQGDGSGRRKSASARKSVGRQSTPRDVIAIDDD